MENKNYCGGCVNMINENLDGIGICNQHDRETHCGKMACDSYKGRDYSETINK